MDYFQGAVFYAAHVFIYIFILQWIKRTDSGAPILPPNRLNSERIKAFVIFCFSDMKHFLLKLKRKQKTNIKKTLYLYAEIYLSLEVKTRNERGKDARRQV